MTRLPARAVTVLLALAPACTTVRWSEVQDAPAGRLVDVGSTRGIVVAEGWQPSLEDIRRFEANVAKWFRTLDALHQYTNCGAEFRLSWEHEHYFRQYHASLTPQGRRWMKVQFVGGDCGKNDIWKTGTPVFVADGGMCEFDVEWDVDADRFMPFRGGGGCV